MSIGDRVCLILILLLLGGTANAQVTQQIRNGIFGEGVVGESGNAVVLVNSTGLKIVRIKIGERIYEDTMIQNKADKILVTVSPKRHHMEVFFRGGTHIDWPLFPFAGIHEIVFTLAGNRVVANPK